MAQQCTSGSRHGISSRNQNAINKMHLCSLSITYACPYHNPSTTTMGHSIHTVDIRKTLTHTTPYRLSAFCPVHWKPWFIREENTSPKCQMPSNVNICPLKSIMTMNCSQVETPMRTTSMQMSFPETVSDSLCRNDTVMQTDCCSSCPGGWSQTILEVKMLDVEVLGWCGYTWSAVVRPDGCTAKFNEPPLEMAYGREMNIQFTGNSSGGHSCCQHDKCTLLVASLRQTYAIIMLSNKHLDMPHLYIHATCIYEWCIYIALYCVLLYSQSALQSCGGGGGGASTWMMRLLPQDSGASALTTHQPQVVRRESHRAHQVDGDY